MTHSRTQRRRPTPLLAGLAAAVLSLAVPAAQAAQPVATTPQATSAAPSSAPAAVAPAFRNPVSRQFAETFADPAIIRAKDGWWYSYGTSDPLVEGEGTAHRIPIARSKDLVSWAHVGDAFSEQTLPAWADLAAGASIWAPDIRYVDGQYRMYYVVTQTTETAGRNDNAIGMATAPTPVGPWTDSGGPVVGPRPGASGNPDDFLWTFDPGAVADTDGSQWLFYGSYYGGIHLTRLSDDGTRAVGASTMVAIDNKFEGAYVVRRDGYWYLFASTANCCAGPTTGYSVQVGRSRDLRGPYVDRRGVSLTASRAGGTPTLVQNGNEWIGAGHNAVATDLAGRDWIIYHAIDRADPYLDGTDGINERPMLVDRLDWVDGWPAVRAGRGPSSGPQRGPSGRAEAVVWRDAPADEWWSSRRWTLGSDDQAGPILQSQRAGGLLTAQRNPGQVRVEADLRSVAGAAYGLVTGVGTVSTRVVVDPTAQTVTLHLGDGTATTPSTTTRLPDDFDHSDWHSVALERRGAWAYATLSSARLGDPIADLRLKLPASARRGGRSGAVARGAQVGAANVSVVPVAGLVTHLVDDVVPNRLDRSVSDEFNGATLAPGWAWVREDSAAVVRGGELRWPVQAADLTGSGNDAAVLLRDPGAGSWTAETQLRIDLGTGDIRNYQQGGLIVYVDDDLFVRLSHVSIWNTRQTEFGKETPYAGRLSYGGSIVGPPAATTWLRVTHALDAANGEHEVRAWSSRNGEAWEKGGVWTLPAGSAIRVGLISHGATGAEVRATSSFRYFRLYRP